MTPNPRDPEHLLEHAGYVRQLARELAFDAHLARDLEQEIWLAALQHVPADLRHPRAWLATVARSLAWRARRGASRRAERERFVAGDESVPSTEQILEREELRAQIVRAVLALDEPYRSALVLRYLEELPPQVAAERLGVPLQTLRTRVKRGVEELERRLEREHGGNHGAWCLSLVLGLRLEPASHWSLAGKALLALVTGGLVVSLPQKMLAATAALALLVAGWMVWKPLALPARGAELEARSSQGAAGLEREGALSTPDSGAQRTIAAAAADPLPSAPEPRATGSLRLRVEWSDGTPAAGIGVRLVDSASFGQEALRFFRTDERGEIACDSVPRGVGVLRIDRWLEEVRFDLWSSPSVEKTVRLPAGVDLVGRVRTSEGTPVADARVLLTTPWDAAVELELARSASDGSFRVRSLVDPGPGALLATKEGFVATPAVHLYRGTELLREVELVFEGSAGVLAGRVLDPRGQPVAGALVAAGDPRGFRSERRADGSRVDRGLMLGTRSDADGAYRLEGLVPGTRTLWVRARATDAGSLAVWRGEVELGVQGETRRDIRLEAGVEVAGRVIDAHGDGVFGALVETRGSREGAELDAQRTQAGPDGSFRLAGLPAVELELVASANERGEASTRVLAPPGEHVQWNPLLGKGLTLRGRVERGGRATGTLDLVAWIVRDGRPEHVQETSAFEDGRFEFANCPDLQHHVEVRSRGASTARLAALDGVRPGAGEFVIVLDPAALPEARLHGRVVDEHGEPVRAGRILMFCIDPLAHVQAELASEHGEFSVGPLQGGSWSLSIEVPGYALLARTGIELAGREDRDLGTLELVRGGTVRVQVKRADGQALEHAQAELHALDGSASDFVPLHDGEGTSRQLPPGRYSLAVRASGAPELAIGCTTIEVAPDAAAQAELVLRPGSRVALRWSDGRPAASAKPAAFVLRDAAGRRVLAAALEFAPGAVVQSESCLEPGRYRVESYPSGLLLDEFELGAGASALVERAIAYRER